MSKLKSKKSHFKKYLQNVKWSFVKDGCQKYKGANGLMIKLIKQDFVASILSLVNVNYTYLILAVETKYYT